MPTGETSWLHRLPGQFIVFDGPDGSGKTTQLNRFADYAQHEGLEVCRLRDPGGTEVGEQIRRILLRPDNDEPLDLTCEMLLFMASRAQLMAQCIRPALAQQQLVLVDRFISSTLAYQGAAGGLTVEQIKSVGTVALGDCWPRLVVIFDVDEATAAERLTGKAKRSRFVDVEQPSLFSDRIEVRGNEFQRRVRQGFLDQAKSDPGRYLVIDATPDADTVFESLLTAMHDQFND